jgi:hypothetical protein
MSRKQRKPHSDGLDPRQGVAIVFLKEEYRWLMVLLDHAAAKAVKPKGWRDSEWAMTRAQFDRVRKSLPAWVAYQQTPVELPWEEWCGLLYHAARSPKDSETFDEKLGFLMLYDRLEMAKPNGYTSVVAEIGALQKELEIKTELAHKRRSAARPNSVALVETRPGDGAVDGGSNGPTDPG